MALCVSLRAFHIASYLALCFSVVVVVAGFSRFSTVITSLVEKRAGLCASRAFVVYFARVDFRPSSLPLGFEG